MSRGAKPMLRMSMRASFCRKKPRSANSFAGRSSEAVATICWRESTAYKRDFLSGAYLTRDSCPFPEQTSLVIVSLDDRTKRTEKRDDSHFLRSRGRGKTARLKHEIARHSSNPVAGSRGACSRFTRTATCRSGSGPPAILPAATNSSGARRRLGHACTRSAVVGADKRDGADSSWHCSDEKDSTPCRHA